MPLLTGGGFWQWTGYKQPSNCPPGPYGAVYRALFTEQYVRETDPINLVFLAVDTNTPPTVPVCMGSIQSSVLSTICEGD